MSYIMMAVSPVPGMFFKVEEISLTTGSRLQLRLDARLVSFLAELYS